MVRWKANGMGGLQDRVFAVSGGAGGIAKGIAEAILDAGGRAGLMDIDGAKVEAATAVLNAGDRVVGLVADVVDPSSTDSALRLLIDRMGRLDGLSDATVIIRGQSINIDGGDTPY